MIFATSSGESPGTGGMCPKLPVVAHHAVRDRALEEPVRMVPGLIDLVKEWRSLVGTGRVLAVANGAVLGKEWLTRLRLGRELWDDDGVGGHADDPPCTAPDESQDDESEDRDDPLRSRAPCRTLR